MADDGLVILIKEGGLFKGDKGFKDEYP